MLYAPNNNSQMVNNVHRCAKYYLRGTQTEEIPDIRYFLQESLWLKSRFGMEQIGANKNPDVRLCRFIIMQGTVKHLDCHSNHLVLYHCGNQ